MGQCYCYVSNNSPFAPPRYTAVLTLRVGIIKQVFFPHKISYTDGKTSVILSV